MIDGSTTRRGKLCWYHQPNVGPAAINDALLIYQCMVEVLEINFGKTPLIAEIMKLINEVSMRQYAIDTIIILYYLLTTRLT